MPITSEYWITNTGEILEADGDTGDNNHMGWVCNHIINMIYEHAHNDQVAEVLIDAIGPNNWDCDATAMREALLNASDTLAKNDPKKYAELYEDYEQCLIRSGIPQKAIDVLWGQDNDPREWAMEELGWIVVKRDSIVMYGLNNARVRLLRDGIWDIIMREGDDEIPSDLEFSLVNTDSGERYTITMESLEDGLLSSLHRHSRLNAAALPGR